MAEIDKKKKEEQMESQFAGSISEYAFQRDQQEFNLGDTLDIKTGLILAALTFLAIQSGELIKPWPSVHQTFAQAITIVCLQAISVVCLILAGGFSVYELMPREYDRDPTPEEYVTWIEQKKEAGHQELELPNIVAELRLKLVNQRIATNLAINMKKTKAMNRAFWLMVFAFGFNIITLLMRLF
jgi:hypothetical protein